MPCFRRPPPTRELWAQKSLCWSKDWKHGQAPSQKTFTFSATALARISPATRVRMIPKKVELLIRFFEPFWISSVFHFSLRTFGEVADLPGPLETSDKTYTQSKFDISGSNETMQNALASIVKVWRIFEIFFMFHEFQKFELLYFSSDLGEICYGG